MINLKELIPEWELIISYWCNQFQVKYFISTDQTEYPHSWFDQIQKDIYVEDISQIQRAVPSTIACAIARLNKIYLNMTPNGDEWESYQVSFPIELNDNELLNLVVLHEIAHVVNEWGRDREAECNEWAYKTYKNSSVDLL